MRSVRDAVQRKGRTFNSHSDHYRPGIYGDVTHVEPQIHCDRWLVQEEEEEVQVFLHKVQVYKKEGRNGGAYRASACTYRAGLRGGGI
ncbi:hypothetical protein Mapa_009946 [Marchantia paleacea]|nr:hypothetical protein Mapa_009946 [Marchantia paleacea]